MTLRVTLFSILLLFMIFYFAVYDVIAATNIACPRDHPGHIKCREINADCFQSENGGYNCLCSEGYWMLDGKCQKSEWCADGEIGDIVCKSNGTVCKNLQWTIESHTKVPYKCECESKVVHAQSRICIVTSSYCQKKGATSYTSGNITVCDCDQNSFFDYSTSKCQNLDLCPFKECKGKYEECQGGECVCKTAYDKIGEECKPKNYCLTNNNCGSAKCEEGPVDDPKSTRCYCDSGYVLVRKDAGPYCKLIRCDTHTLNPCDQLCILSPDNKTSRCECLPGHTLKPDGITCEIQAQHKCDFNHCSSKSICVKLIDTGECMCKNSLVARDQTCLDRCAAGRLQGTCPGECKSTENGFQCICEGKYKLSKNQVTCEERQMCLKGEEGFLNCRRLKRICVERPETEKGFMCDKCLHGLQEHEESCIDLCQLDENKHYCEERGGTCVFVNGVTHEVKCRCPPFLTWSKSVGCVFARHSYTGLLRIFDSYRDNKTDNSSRILRYGEDGLDWKMLDHDIGNSMSTTFGQALSQANVLQCGPDRSDENHELCIVCAIELQLHFEDYGILERLNSLYICRGRNKIPQMFCFIPPYLKLVPSYTTSENVHALFHKSDACGYPYGHSVCPASTECLLEDVGFSCRCKMGFVVKRTVFLNSDKSGIIEVCEDTNECENGEPCPMGTICINTIGDFECRCKPGLYRWHNSSDRKKNICTKACDPINCVHGTCENHNQVFYCRCHTGYTGVYCEATARENDHKGMGQTAIIAIGIIEAIVAFVIFAAIFYRFWIHRKPKSKEKSFNCNTTPKDHNVRNRSIDHLHMRKTVEPNGGSRPPLEEDPDDAIYADCTQVR